MGRDSDVPETGRTCGACGGAGNNCRWCTDGYQDAEQQARWRAFKSEMTKISGTYHLLEQIIRELITRLDASPFPGSAVLATDGRMRLDAWLSAEPMTDERVASTKGLLEFQRKALDHLLQLHASKPG